MLLECQSKDTVKIVDENQFAVNTPDTQNGVWIVQTPQVFETLSLLQI